MKEIRIAVSNTVRMLDIQLSMLEHDIEILDDIEKMDDSRIDVKAEKHYKHVIRQKLVDEKINLLDILTLEKQAEVK